MTWKCAEPWTTKSFVVSRDHMDFFTHKKRWETKVQVHRCCRLWVSPSPKLLLPRRFSIVCWRFRQSFFKLCYFHCWRTCSALQLFRSGSGHIQPSSTCHQSCSRADIFWPRTTIPNIPERRNLSSRQLLGSCQTRELVLGCLSAKQPAMLVKFCKNTF